MGSTVSAARGEPVAGWQRGAGEGPPRPRGARQATDVAQALEFLMQVTRRRTICFVVSDFLDEGFEHAMVSAKRKHDVIAVLVTDPNELEVPDVGLVALRDAETGEARIVDTGASSFRAEARRRGCFCGRPAGGSAAGRAFPALELLAPDGRGCCRGRRVVSAFAAPAAPAALAGPA